MLFGLLIFGGLILLCFGFALVLLQRGGEGSDGDGPRVGIVPVSGVIRSSRKPLEALRTFRRDESIKAIVVRIDSPGGAVGPSQEIYREIERTRKKKPVVASMGTLAASGGYYIAAACEKIVANPGTITGSIGVIMQTTHVQELLQLARVQTNTFKSGEFKDTGSPVRPMTEEDRRFVQGFIGEIYGQFLRDVARGRKLPEAKVKKVADGRILSGEQARAAGLVDAIGNLSDALELAGKLAKAEGEPVPVYPRSRKGLLGELLDESVESAAEGVQRALESSTRIEVREPAMR